MQTNRLPRTNGNGSESIRDSVELQRETPSSSRLLTSWKEIAVYLGKGVRTVQRWERELNLPVRRPGNGKHVVLATAADLESWVATLQHSPVSGACCDCKPLLERANAQIAALQQENVKLRSLLATKGSAKAKTNGTGEKVLSSNPRAHHGSAPQ